MVCVRCARPLRVAVMGRVTGHAPQCPDVVEPPVDGEAFGVEWREGYEAGWDAAREVLVGDVVALYRRRLAQLLRTARQGFGPAARVDPQIALDTIEVGAEREGLL